MFADSDEVYDRLSLLQPAAAWAIMWVAAVASSDFHGAASAIAFAAGVASVAAMAWAPGAWRPLLVLAVIVGLIGPAAPWVIAAASLSLLARSRIQRSGYDVAGDPQIQLDRSRRRGEPASVVVVAMPAKGTTPRRALETFRTTDGLAVRCTSRQLELYGVLDTVDPPREIIEQRLADAVGHAAPTIGWARFPDDGWTLEALLEHARRSMSAPRRSQLATELPGSEVALGETLDAHAVISGQLATPPTV